MSRSPAPDSRLLQTRKAELVLTRLLRTPKTRNGLVAAVTSKMISRRFVFGWLTEQIRTGGVAVLKSGATTTYQIKGQILVEAPARSVYPSWLDPRALPSISTRSIFLDGVIVTDIEQTEKNNK